MAENEAEFPYNIPPEARAAAKEYGRRRVRDAAGNIVEFGQELLGKQHPASTTGQYLPYEIELHKLRAELEAVEADREASKRVSIREILRYQTQSIDIMMRGIENLTATTYKMLSETDKANFHRARELKKSAETQLQTKGWERHFQKYASNPPTTDKSALEYYRGFIEIRTVEDPSVPGGYKQVGGIAEGNHDAVIAQLAKDIVSRRPEEVALFITQLGNHEGAGGISFNVEQFFSEETPDGTSAASKHFAKEQYGTYTELYNKVGHAVAIKHERRKVDAKWNPKLLNAVQGLANVGGKDKQVGTYINDLMDRAEQGQKQLAKIYDAFWETEGLLNQAGTQYNEAGDIVFEEPLFDRNAIYSGAGEALPTGEAPPTVAPAEVAPPGEAPVEPEPIEPAPAVPGAPTGAVAPAAAPETATAAAPAAMPAGVSKQRQLMEKALTGYSTPAEGIANALEEIADLKNAGDPEYKQLEHTLMSDKGTQDYIKEKGWENLPPMLRNRWLAQDIRKNERIERKVKTQDRMEEILKDPTYPKHLRAYAALRTNMAKGGSPDTGKRELFYGLPGSAMTKLGSGLSGVPANIFAQRKLKGEVAEEKAKKARRADEIDPVKPKSLGPEEDIPKETLTEKEIAETISRSKRPQIKDVIRAGEEGILREEPKGTLFISGRHVFWLDKESGKIWDITKERIIPAESQEAAKAVLEKFRESEAGGIIDPDDVLKKGVTDIEDMDVPDITEGYVPVGERGLGLEGPAGRSEDPTGAAGMPSQFGGPEIKAEGLEARKEAIKSLLDPEIIEEEEQEAGTYVGGKPIPRTTKELEDVMYAGDKEREELLERVKTREPDMPTYEQRKKDRDEQERLLEEAKKKAVTEI